MFNDTTSTLRLLATRRSGKPRDMIAPGPNDAQLRAILCAAIRVPDHGKLAPWRFVTIAADQRPVLAMLLERAFVAANPQASRIAIDAACAFAFEAPCLIVALSCPRPDAKIPLWEQELSAGAACMNLLIAAHAHGFVASWITGWATYNEAVGAAFGQPGERIAGFIYVGSPSRPLEERPRPAYDEVISSWTPAQK
ncbi:MAG: nitroreductase [Alphaproteobacteria bacterium]|nr:nitroreductase [Alphaproteobacteria bacterium]